MPENDPLISIKEEVREKIEALGAELDESERVISALEEIGMDMTKMKEHLATSRKMRDVVLKVSKKPK